MTFRAGELSAPNAARLNEMYRELQRWRQLSVAYPLTLNRSAGSVTISTATTQPGFPAELTAVWDATIGYTAKRLLMSDVELVDATAPQEYIRVIAPDGDETLTVGTRGWLEPDPRRSGYIFIPSASASVSSWKTPPVRCSTTAALPACTYANGSSGVGATLTGNANGALSAQDGVTLAAGEDILVQTQASALQNGIYRLTQVGTGGTPFILTRRTDADTAAKLLAAAVVSTEGTLNKDKIWLCEANETITVGTTGLSWKDISGDVRGPSSSTLYAVPIYGDTTGELITNSTLLFTPTFDGSNPQATLSGVEILAIRNVTAATKQYVFAMIDTNQIGLFNYTDIASVALFGNIPNGNLFVGELQALDRVAVSSAGLFSIGLNDGVTGTLGVGAVATGGIVTSLGTGTAATTGDITTAISALSSVYQPLHADLTAISAGTWTGATSITDLGTITTGTWTGTTIAVANGGTDATDASTARTNLGVAIGTDVQAYSARLDTLAAGTSSAVTDLTDSTTGTAGATVNDVTAAFDQTILNDNFASILAKLAELTAALQTAGVIT